MKMEEAKQKGDEPRFEILRRCLHEKLLKARAWLQAHLSS